ncbi:arsenate reductase [Taibaiella sp. KBW10]|nr:arsenate reductase [Taibaiella sp. KBW10]
MTIFGIPNCDSVKKALKWLEAHQLAYQFHNYKKEGIDARTLDAWCTQVGWEIILNKKGTTWRALTDQEKANTVDKASAIILMQEKTSLIKRPVITKGNKVVVVGYDEAALALLNA